MKDEQVPRLLRNPGIETSKGWSSATSGTCMISDNNDLLITYYLNKMHCRYFEGKEVDKFMNVALPFR